MKKNGIWRLKKKKLSFAPFLSYAVNHINISIDLYEMQSAGYASIEKEPWWLYCHRSILLKLSGDHNLFTDSLTIYQDYIERALSVKNNLFRKSLQVYAASYYLLLDSPAELEAFFTRLDQDKKLAEGDQDENDLTTIEAPSEIDNFTYHHLDLIFFESPEKKQQYRQILNNWFYKRLSKPTNG